MLYVIWFGVALALSLLSASVILKDESDDSAGWYLMYLIAGCFAQFVIFGVVHEPFFYWLKMSLPNQDTFINEFTAYFLVFFPSVFLLALPLVLVVLTKMASVLLETIRTDLGDRP